MSGEATTLGRRRFLRLVAMTPVVVAVGSRVRWLTAAEAAFAGEPDVSTASLTPECGDDDEPTPGETIHERVQAPRGRILTTQLYFPNEPRNTGDRLFRPDLLMSVKEAGKEKQARFHFLLDAA
jgi:hypothetical protein